MLQKQGSQIFKVGIFVLLLLYLSPTIELVFGSHTFNRKQATISKGFNVVVFAAFNCGMLAIASGRR